MVCELENGQMFVAEFEKVFKDFDLFTRALISSNDVDPTYPMIHDIAEYYGYEYRWFAFMYQSFYSLESAILTCEWMPDHEHWDAGEFRKWREKNHLQFGVERRGLRRLDAHVEHLDSVVRFIPEMGKYTTDNRTYRRAVEALPHNGGWASFKNAEIFEKGFGYDSLSIVDLGISHRNPNSDKDGPIPALRLLYGWNNHYNGEYIKLWDRFGENLARAYDVSIGKIETSLCKYIKPYKGKYYIGHDIDEFHALKEVMGDKAWKEVMSNNFDERFWLKPVTHNDIRKKRKHYTETGEYLNVDFAEQMKSADVVEILLNTN